MTHLEPLAAAQLDVLLWWLMCCVAVVVNVSGFVMVVMVVVVVVVVSLMVVATKVVKVVVRMVVMVMEVGDETMQTSANYPCLHCSTFKCLTFWFWTEVQPVHRSH